jgi:hypothetical protein
MEGERAFLSHGGDDAELVAQFASELERSGVDVFLDKWDIRPGQPIWTTIDRAIDESSWMILFLSSKTLLRKGVLEELDRGYQKAYERHGQDYLIPVALDEMDSLLPSLPLGIRFRSILPAYELDLENTVQRLNAIINHQVLPREPSAVPTDFFCRLYDYGTESRAVIEIATALPVRSEFGCGTLWTEPVLFPRFNWGPPGNPATITMPDSSGGMLQFATGTNWSRECFDTHWHISFHNQAIRRDRSFYMAFAWSDQQCPTLPPSIALFDAWGNCIRESLPWYPSSQASGSSSMKSDVQRRSDE